jgi:hypothetical protein
VKLIFFLVEVDMEPIREFLLSRIGSRFAPNVVPLFYRKLFAKKSMTETAREAWRHALKRELRNIAAPFSTNFAKSCRLLAVCVYRYFLPNGHFPGGVYIFSDLERLSEEGTTQAKALRRMLARSKSPVRIVNDPDHVRLRYDLLRTLYEQGINDFDVYRPIRGELPRKFPVFLRHENSHAGPISNLIENGQELAFALRELKEQGNLTKHVLIAEFANTADEKGIYRKYGAFVVGDRVFPKNINCSRNWVTKTSCLFDPELLEEERDYVLSDPHHDLLKKIFSAGRIDFGRIDYSVLNGNIRVWEINTNPTITVGSQDGRFGERGEIYDLVESRMCLALDRLLEDQG